jgi:hypothetical protein
LEVIRVPKLGHFEKYSRNNMNVLKFGLKKDREERVEEKGNNPPKIE